MPMRFTTELVLERSIAQVWQAFDSPEQMQAWQPTLESFEAVTGTPGQPGAVSRLTYLEGKRTMVLVETITERREPELFAGTYDSGMALNRMTNRFSALDADRTHWKIECEFVFRGFWRLLAPFFRAPIERRTRADVERFKEWLEAGRFE